MEPKLKITSTGYQINHKGLSTNFIVYKDKITIHPFNWVFNDILFDEISRAKLKDIAESLLFISKREFTISWL